MILITDPVKDRVSDELLSRMPEEGIKLQQLLYGFAVLLIDVLEPLPEALELSVIEQLNKVVLGVVFGYETDVPNVQVLAAIVEDLDELVVL